MEHTREVDIELEEEEIPTEIIFRRPGQEIQLEDDEEDESQVDDESNVQVHKIKRINGPKSLPVIPPFTPMVPKFSAHSGFVTLPTLLDMDNITPLTIFNQFFNENMISALVNNTSEYAELNLEEADKKKWNKVDRNEIIIWIAITIYMGIHKEPTIKEYWNTGNRGPIHPIIPLMSYERFRLIRKYFHISKPSSDKSLYKKLEPLLSHVRNKSKQLYTPKSNVSVDEMMVRFSGRSKDIVRIKGKPIPKGYKIISLCDSGYTYTFTTSSKDEPSTVASIPGVNHTGCIVIDLVHQLPYKTRSYNIYMDNYFTSVNLFQYLTENFVGACGTSKATSVFTKGFNLEKDKKYDWNTRSAIDLGAVLAVFWQDNGPVKMLTNIHAISEVGGKCDIETKRKKPRKTSTNAAKARESFAEDEHEKLLMIPRVIDDYNHNMNGVDIADQYRSYYNTQKTSCRNWFPLFHWLLDISIVNSYLLLNKLNRKHSRKETTHKDFRENLLWELIESATTSNTVTLRSKTVESTPPPKRQRVTANFVLNTKRFSADKHWPEPGGPGKRCIWCCYMAFKNKTDPNDACRTTKYCTDCNVSLCFTPERNCHRAYHTIKE